MLAGMTNSAPAPSPEDQLTAFRNRIDALDETITQLLLERCGVVRQVGQLKDTHWPRACHIRSGREGQMHEAIAARFAGTDIPPAIAIAIWRQLIGASTCLESPLSAVFLARQPQHGWLVREYFGITASIRAESCLADMFDTLARNEANLMILPEPGTRAGEGDWWLDPGLFTSHGLAIFARLPVTTDPLPDGSRPALALAAITPEPSGNDISYLALATTNETNAARLQAIAPMQVISANAHHHLLVIEDFVGPDHALLASLRQALGSEVLNLTILGAHPRPISL